MYQRQTGNVVVDAGAVATCPIHDWRRCTLDGFIYEMGAIWEAKGTDGGVGMKPSDRWTISLCREHHAEQHRIGERALERRYEIGLILLAEEFARRSPYLRSVDRIGGTILSSRVTHR